MPIYAAEHAARLKAEAEAQDKAARLRVAQEQLGEYAMQKQQEAAEAVKAATALEEALGLMLQGSAASSNGVSGVVDPSVVMAAVTLLRTRLEDASAEASSFADQQQVLLVWRHLSVWRALRGSPHLLPGLWLRTQYPEH